MQKLGIALALAVAANAGTGWADEAMPASAMPVERLKAAYLACERQALSGWDRLETSEIARCSVIYEELKCRAFDGDWTAIRRWTERNLAARAES